MLTIPAVPRFSARGQDVPLKSETSGRSQYWLFTSFVAVLRKYGFLQHMPLITSMNISTRYTICDGFYIISWTFDGGRTKIDMPYIYIDFSGCALDVKCAKNDIPFILVFIVYPALVRRKYRCNQYFVHDIEVLPPGSPKRSRVCRKKQYKRYI